MKLEIQSRRKLINTMKAQDPRLVEELALKPMIDQGKYVTLHFKYGRMLFDRDDIILIKFKKYASDEIHQRLYMVLLNINLNIAIYPPDFPSDESNEIEIFPSKDRRYQ